jgi:mono/diheme cytochrome c family protein
MRTEVERIACRTCAAVLVAASLLSLACGPARRREPLASPPALDASSERGRVVFMARCHQCHPGGEAGLGPAINNKPLPDFLKRLQVRRGLGTMPAFPKSEISDEELDDLLAYLRALRRNPPRRARAE